MEISKAHIYNFGKLKDFEIVFSNGMNVIYGNNEVGKSTILAFIKCMLYGISSQKRNIRQNDRIRYMPWDDTTAAGEIHITDKDQSKVYIIKRYFGEKKSQDKIQIIDGISGEEIEFENMECPGKYIFGIEESTYEKTFLIKQLSSEINKENSDEVINLLTNLQGSGDADVSFDGARKNLETYRKSIENTKRKPGALDEKKALYDLKFEQLNRIKHMNERFKNSISDSSIDIKFEISQMSALREIISEDQMHLIREKLIQQKNYEEMMHQKKDERLIIESQLDELETMSDMLSMDPVKANEDLRNIIEENIRLENYNEKIEKYNKVKQDIIQLKEEKMKINEATQGLDKLEYAIEEAEGLAERINDLRANINQTRNRTHSGQAFNYRFALTASIFVFMMAIVAAIMIRQMPMPVAVIFVLPVFYFFNRHLRSQREKNHFEAEQEKSLEALQVLENRLVSIYKSFEVKNLRQLQEKLQSARINEGRINTMISEKEALLEDYDGEQLIELVKKSKASIKVILEKYNCMNKEALKDKIEKQGESKIQYNQYKENKERLKGEEEKLSEKIHKLSEDMIEEVAIIYDNSIAFLEIQLAQLKKQINQYQNELEAIDYAIIVLDEAFQRFHKEFGSRLNNASAEILSAITSERYNQLYISKDFDVRVSDHIEKEIRNIDYFSNGTWDQIYFSVRMGIAKIVFEKLNRYLPIFLDDAFVQYDDSRMSTVLEHLHTYSESNQVILFTCQKREMDYLEKYENINSIMIS